MPKKRTEGWGKIFNAAKWHYFMADGKSLCDRWLSLGTPLWDEENDPTMNSKDNCSTCYTKLMKKETGVTK